MKRTNKFVPCISKHTNWPQTDACTIQEFKY